MNFPKLFVSTLFFIFVHSAIYGQGSPPEFINAPDEIFLTPNTPYIINIWDIVDDPDTPDEDLTYTFMASTGSIELFYDEFSGELTITPIDNISGIEGLDITVSDPDFNEAFHTITLNIESVNTPPEFVNAPDEIFMTQNTPYILDVWDIVQDAETPDDGLTYSFFASTGSIELFYDESSGELTITPIDNISGTEGLDITVSDPEFEEVMHTITLNIEAVNTPPEFVNPPVEIIMAQETPYIFNVWDIVQDAETPDDGLTYLFSVSTGSIELFYDESIGELTITPIDNISGIEGLDITVSDPELEEANIAITLNIEVVNTPPEFVNPPAEIIMTQNTPYILDVWDIVQDAETSDEGLNYSFSVSTGSIELFYDESSGELTITPIDNISGIEGLDITVSDPELEEASIAITLNIQAVNTPPEFVNPPAEINMTQNTPYIFNVWDIVQDAETPDDGLTYSFFTSTGSIELFYDESSGELTITPIDNISGTEGLDITVSDPEFEEIFMTITLNIEAVNTPPEFVNAPDEINLVANTAYILNIWEIVQDAETSDDGLNYSFSVSTGSIELFFDESNGELTITPVDNFSGTEGLDITVSDPEFEEAFLTITLNVQNTPPEFVNAPTEINMVQNTPYVFNVWDIVQDAETNDDGLSYAFFVSTESLELFYDESSGELTITPVDNISGTEGLDITVSDPQLEEAFVSIALNIEAVNSPPEFVNAPAEINMVQNTPYVLNVWDIVQDAETMDDGLNYSFSVSTGSIELFYDESTGELTITPMDNISGSEGLDITVSDPQFEEAILAITLNIEAVNSGPQFVNLPDTLFLQSNSLFVLNMWPFVEDTETGDQDLDYFFSLDDETVILSYDDASGNLEINPNGHFGEVVLQITIEDESTATNSSSIVLAIEFENAAPQFVGLPDTLFLQSNSLYILNLWPYIQDDATSDENLEYSFTIFNETITTVFNQESGNLQISPNAYFGVVELHISIADEGGASISSSTVLDIEFENTPPQFVDLPDTLFLLADVTNTINIWQYIEDDATATEDLIYSFSVNIDTVTLSYESISGDLEINTNGFFGFTVILQITIEDENEASISSSIVLVIEGNNSPQFVDLPDTLFLQSNSSLFLNIWPFIEDAETNDEDLDYSFSIDNETITLVFSLATGELEINPNDFWGTTILHLTIKDATEDSVAASIVLVIEQVISSLRSDQIITKLSLEQNYPNPFNSSTQIKYQINENSVVTLKVFDIVGREKATLVNARQTVGDYTVAYDASLIPSGIYFYRLTTSTGIIETKRMMLLK